ncbi:ATP-binding protein [Streptomyces sp. DSM 44917]|uniref:ATP-binding protein n=1 Tax=Streptomyces boetiae TaxID=3075541 RepID=A0ABU2LD21_9ACTN|nr:ATP-binding protein [Streptomyces sp. DSM 44917]MDT0309417.1 ATP-binding protein [Streptomyces sp. DSM 44917]
MVIRCAEAPDRQRADFHVEFRAVPARAGQVCRIVTAQLRYWRLPQLVDSAGAGVGRLLADVRRHGGSERSCTVEVRLLWDRVAVAVRDHRRGGHPVPAVAAVRDSGGVRAHQDERGRTVWFTLPVPFPPTPPEARALPQPWATHA